MSRRAVGPERRPRARLPRRRLDRPPPPAGAGRTRGRGEVAAIADPSDGARARAAARWRPRRRLVDAPRTSCSQLDLDGVVIATPSALHAEQAHRGARARARRLLPEAAGAHGERDRAVVDRRGARADRLLGVDLSYRHTEAMRRIRELRRRRRARPGVRGRPGLPQRLRSRQAVVLRPRPLRRRLRHRPRHPPRRPRAVDARAFRGSSGSRSRLLRRARPLPPRHARSRTTRWPSSTSPAARRCAWPAPGGCRPARRGDRGARSTAPRRRGAAQRRRLVLRLRRRALPGHAPHGRWPSRPTSGAAARSLDWARRLAARRALRQRDRNHSAGGRGAGRDLWPMRRELRGADDRRHGRRRVDLRARAGARARARGVRVALATMGAPRRRPQRREALAGCRRVTLHESTSGSSGWRTPWDDVGRGRRLAAGAGARAPARRRAPQRLRARRPALRRARRWWSPTPACVSWWRAVHGEDPPAGLGPLSRERARGPGRRRPRRRTDAGDAAGAGARLRLAAHRRRDPNGRAPACSSRAQAAVRPRRGPAAGTRRRTWRRCKRRAAAALAGARRRRPRTRTAPQSMPASAWNALGGLSPRGSGRAACPRRDLRAAGALRAVRAVGARGGPQRLRAGARRHPQPARDLGAAAVYVAPDDDGALRATLRRLIAVARRARRDWAQRARARARRFTPRRMADGYLGAYALLEPALAAATREELQCA